MWLLSHVPNMPASHISILHDARGPNNSITQTDLGSLLALGEACRKIQLGQADIMLVGGADHKINPITLVRHCLYAPLSRRNENPAAASRPFERDRDGTVLGEGSGVLVVEELSHALGRKAGIYGEVLGFFAGFDAKKAGQGFGRVIKAAVERANIDPANLDHVNAQGYGTRADDAWEARGLRPNAAIAPRWSARPGQGREAGDESASRGHHRHGGPYSPWKYGRILISLSAGGQERRGHHQSF
jgi:3-oxoacyl-[acyl-carrier-protein] synthase II